MTDEELADALEEAATGPARTLMRVAAARLRELSKGATKAAQPPPPVAYPPNALLTLAEAAAYVRRTPQALRTACSRGQLVPDGKGPRGTHLFFARTMAAFATRGGEAATATTPPARPRARVRKAARSEGTVRLRELVENFRERERLR